MKFDLVKDEISVLLENMSEQFEMINQHENNIPQIELDIFMRNIQKLYENAIVLNRSNPPQKQAIAHFPKKEKDSEIAKEDTQVTIEEKQIVKNETPKILVEEVVVKEEKPIPESQKTTEEVILEKKEPEIKVEDVKKEVIEVEEKKEVEPQKVEEPTLSFDDILVEPEKENDLFSDIKANSEILDLNKKLADARNTQSIVEKLQSKRIESLKTVIGINDKFYFINELFSGDSQKYEDIIYTLNNFKKLEDAMVYFSTLKYKFGWDEDTEAFAKLSLMLERKFELTNA